MLRRARRARVLRYSSSTATERSSSRNTGVALLQEADPPNQFVIYDALKAQAAFNANERPAHSAELRAKLTSMGGAPYDRRDYRLISVGQAQAAVGVDTVYMPAASGCFPPRIEPTLAAAPAVAEAAHKAMEICATTSSGRSSRP